MVREKTGRLKGGDEQTEMWRRLKFKGRPYRLNRIQG